MSLFMQGLFDNESQSLDTSERATWSKFLNSLASYSRMKLRYAAQIKGDDRGSKNCNDQFWSLKNWFIFPMKG